MFYTVYASIFTSAEAVIEYIIHNMLYFEYISQLIPLKEVTPEYQCVAGYVKNDGLLRGSIVSISRIQNIDLWEIFCR